MKICALFVIAALSSPALVAGYMMGGYNLLRRPMIASGSNCFSYRQPDDGGDDFARCRKQYSRSAAPVDKAFQDLINELNDSFASPRSGKADVQKQKEWIKRAFGMASDFVRDTAMSEGEVQKNEELLRKQQKWVDKIIDFASDLSEDFSPPAKGNIENGHEQPDEDSRESKKTADGKQAMAGDEFTVTGDEYTVTPSYTINDDESAFQVALELPGVKLSAINIDFDPELQILTISGERDMIGSGRKINFSKIFGLEPSIMVDQITANLSNGILLVSAPKEKKKKETKDTIKIPVLSDV